MNHQQTGLPTHPGPSDEKQTSKRKVKVKSLSHIQLFVTPWTVACQASLSMDSPGKDTGVSCHFILQTNLDSILKSRDIALATKVHLVKAMVFPVVTYECESWIIKTAECRRIDAFELWC